MTTESQYTNNSDSVKPACFMHLFPSQLKKELNWAEITCVGSRTILGGFNSSSDYDFLVFIPDNKAHVMERHGFRLETGGSHYEPSSGQFNSWRNDNLNIILTYNRTFANDYLGANALAVALGLKNRTERVLLFQSILYRNYPPVATRQSLPKGGE